MKKLLYGFAVMLFAAVPALAGMQGGDGELGAGIGSTQLDSDTGFDSGTSLAVRGGYFFNPAWELEGQLASSSADTDVAGTNVDGTFRMYMVNGVYNFKTPKEIVPYVLAGVGFADTEVQASGLGSTSDNGTAYQIGGGSRFFFGKAKKAAFRVDLSRITENTFDETSTHTNLSAGFTWKLGK